jgi:hypothetical protein
VTTLRQAQGTATATEVVDSDLLRLHALGTELLVVMQNVCEHRGRRMQARATARKLRERGMDWAVVTDATGIVEADLGQGLH